MRKLSVLLMLLVLYGCSGTNSSEAVNESHTIIEWADFIKINERKYELLHTLAIADEQYIGEQTGTVKFNVSENIDNPNYRVKEGDAAFLKKGTPIYSVQNMPDVIAVRDENIVNNYRLYQSNDSKRMWNFDHMKQDDINRIEIYKEEPELKVVKVFEDEKDIKELLDILTAGEERAEGDLNVQKEPVRYELVFYDERPVASFYPLLHEGKHWYWHPWEEEILPKKIERFIKEK